MTRLRIEPVLKPETLIRRIGGDGLVSYWEVTDGYSARRCRGEQREEWEDRNRETLHKIFD
jgi:hypothetical protein